MKTVLVVMGDDILDQLQKDLSRNSEKKDGCYNKRLNNEAPKRSLRSKA